MSEDNDVIAEGQWRWTTGTPSATDWHLSDHARGYAFCDATIFDNADREQRPLGEWLPAQRCVACLHQARVRLGL